MAGMPVIAGRSKNEISNPVSSLSVESKIIHNPRAAQKYQHEAVVIVFSLCPRCNIPNRHIVFEQLGQPRLDGSRVARKKAFATASPRLKKASLSSKKYALIRVANVSRISLFVIPGRKTPVSEPPLR